MRATAVVQRGFKTVLRELEKAARGQGCGFLGVLWRAYVPVARPSYLAGGAEY